jgi:hypothetical protein
MSLLAKQLLGPMSTFQVQGTRDKGRKFLNRAFFESFLHRSLTILVGTGFHVLHDCMHQRVVVKMILPSSEREYAASLPST